MKLLPAKQKITHKENAIHKLNDVRCRPKVSLPRASVISALAVAQSGDEIRPVGILHSE